MTTEEWIFCTPFSSNCKGTMKERNKCDVVMGVVVWGKEDIGYRMQGRSWQRA
jgi:hypothetical protein